MKGTMRGMYEMREREGERERESIKRDEEGEEGNESVFTHPIVGV